MFNLYIKAFFLVSILIVAGLHLTDINLEKQVVAPAFAQEHCEEECEPEEPTPTPPPSQPPVTSNAGRTVSAPVCSDGSTTKLVDNLHVIRNGSSATVNYFITEGDSSNIYWKLNSSTEWQHAVSDIRGNSDNYVSFTINDLDPIGDYTFGIQQVKGCGGGELATSVVVDDFAPNTFRMSYWTW